MYYVELCRYRYLRYVYLLYCIYSIWHLRLHVKCLYFFEKYRFHHHNIHKFTRITSTPFKTASQLFYWREKNKLSDSTYFMTLKNSKQCDVFSPPDWFSPLQWFGKITICFRVGISPFSPAFFVGSFRPGATKPDKYTAAVSPVVNNTCIGKRILSRKKQERAQHKFKGMEDWPIFCLFLTSQAVIWPNWNQPKSNLRATCQLRGQFPNSSAMPSILGPRDYEYDLLSFRILLSISLTKI